MGNNTDRSYWLREFAGRAMQAYQSREGALCLPPGCPVEDAIAKWSTDQAEALLSAIECKERESADKMDHRGAALVYAQFDPAKHVVAPDPTTRELVEAARALIPFLRPTRSEPGRKWFSEHQAFADALDNYDAAHPNPPSDAKQWAVAGTQLRCPKCNDLVSFVSQDAHERTCWNPPSDGSVVANTGHAGGAASTAPQARAPAHAVEQARGEPRGVNPEWLTGRCERASVCAESLRTTPSPGTEDAQAGHSLTLADAEPCGCGGELAIIGVMDRRVHCRSCGMDGPIRPTNSGAILAWNRALRRPASPPRALTEAEKAWLDSWGGNEPLAHANKALAAELRARRDAAKLALDAAQKGAHRG